MGFMGKGGIKTSAGKLSVVQLLVLILLKENPAHGYDILLKLRERLGGWNLRSGTVYPVLHKLLEKELITGVHIPQESTPDAVEYTLTSLGKDVLQEAIRSLDTELQVQEDLWEFLSSAFTAESARRLRQWTVRERSPMGFVVMSRHCGTRCHDKHHLDFLKQYMQYLQQELEWVCTQLAELKKAK